MILDKITNIFRNNSKNLATMSLAACMSLSSFFNGEKDFLAMGIPKVYNVDYYTMADRAYDLYITNEFVRIAINRVVEFAVGKGLELVAEPDEDFLKRKYNIKLDENFTKDIQNPLTGPDYQDQNFFFSSQTSDVNDTGQSESLSSSELGDQNSFLIIK